MQTGKTRSFRFPDKSTRLKIIFLILNANICRGTQKNQGAQWLSGRVLDSRLKGRRLEPHRRHCVVVLEQDTFIQA